MRWEHRRRSTIPPGAFLPIVIELGLLAGVGQAVLDYCRDFGSDQRLAVDIAENPA